LATVASTTTMAMTRREALEITAMSFLSITKKEINQKRL
jgi:hypothetical protein